MRKDKLKSLIRECINEVRISSSRRKKQHETEERLAQELFGYVMKNIPWDHNVEILQSIYRKVAKELLKRYTLRKRINK